MPLFRRLTAATLSLSMLVGSVAHAGPAGLIGTEQLAASLAPADAGHRARLLGTLASAELAAQLQARGVSVDAVRSRVNALTEAEAAQLLAQIDRAPAGADVLGVVVSLFVLLLVTDILGLTKVFPFTRSVR